MPCWVLMKLNVGLQPCRTKSGLRLQSTHFWVKKAQKIPLSNQKNHLKFNFTANLPQVLDTNFDIGKFILVNCVLILQKTPFPPRYATAWQQGYTLMQVGID